MDWEQAKMEFITGAEPSQAALARKYGVSPRAISRRAAQEDWLRLRREFAEGGEFSLRQQQERRLRKVRQVADSLVSRVEEAARQENLNPASLRQLSGALRELKDIQGLKSELDTQEQEARIDRLRRDIRESGDSVTITMEGWADEFAR